MSLEKRLRYLEKAWQQRLEQQESQEEDREKDPQEQQEQEHPRQQQQRKETTPTVQPFAARQGWEQTGRYTLLRRLHFPASLAEAGISEYLLPSGYTPADLLFFDTETTGLSGGAGNSIFLMGMAWIEGTKLTVEQVFMKDFPGEAEFLGILSERFDRHRVFVSYNGRAFDAHVLRTRFLLNRMSFALEHQTDLLYWSRRLWRRVLPDCSLGTVEREILGIRRELDVPGFEVPGIYLEYLRSGRVGRLDAVLEHNLQDVRSLAELLTVINSILSSGAPGRSDRTALGSFFLSRNEQWGVELLKESFSAGDEEAGRALSLYYKRAGAWVEAADVWKQMALRRRSLFAAVELAKYFEHRERNVELALEWIQNILSWRLPLESRIRVELHHRRRRLLRKLEGRTSRS